MSGVVNQYKTGNITSIQDGPNERSILYCNLINDIGRFDHRVFVTFIQ